MFDKGSSRYRVVGLVGDAPYRTIRETLLPAACMPPFRSVDRSGVAQPRGDATISSNFELQNPLALASTMRLERVRARARVPDSALSAVTTQPQSTESQTLRERLLAMLALFFTIVAVVLLPASGGLRRARPFPGRLSFSGGVKSASAWRSARSSPTWRSASRRAGLHDGPRRRACGLALGMMSAIRSKPVYDVKATDAVALASRR